MSEDKEEYGESGDDLTRILLEAYYQSAHGKGRNRHNPNNLPFAEQKIMTLARLTGTGGPVFQACKKATEAHSQAYRRLYGSAKAELLGAIVYLAAAALLVEELETDSQ